MIFYKTQTICIGTKLDSKVDNFNNSKLWQNSTTQIVKKKTQQLKLWQILEEKKIWQKSFIKNNLKPWQPMRCIQGSHLQSRNVSGIFGSRIVFFFFSEVLTNIKNAPSKAYPHKIGLNWPIRRAETTMLGGIVFGWR